MDKELLEGERIRELLKSFYLENTNIGDVELEKNKLKAHELIAIMANDNGKPTKQKKKDFELRKRYIDAKNTGGTLKEDALAKDLV